MGGRRHDGKLESLRQRGALNPRPDSVRDPAFLEHEFFDPRDLVQIKYELLRRVRTAGESVTEATDRFGLSRPTFYKAQADFEQGGMAGLIPAKRGPRGPHKLTGEAMAFLQEVRDDDPGCSWGDLAQSLHQRFMIKVHPRTIARAFQRTKKKRHS